MEREGADHKSPEGLYFDEETGRPACIVGNAMFYDWGITYKMIEDENGIEIDKLAASEHLILPVEFRMDGLDVLVDAQNFQDLGDTWGEALQKAEEVS